MRDFECDSKNNDIASNTPVMSMCAETRENRYPSARCTVEMQPKLKKEKTPTGSIFVPPVPCTFAAKLYLFFCLLPHQMHGNFWGLNYERLSTALVSKILSVLRPKTVGEKELSLGARTTNL